MGLVCMSDCSCANSVPRQEEERASRVRGFDGTADSWGVIANRDIQCGEVITVFGGTTYLNESERVGADFGQLHARLHKAGEPLQYTFQGRLAESSNAKIWAIPEPDKAAVRGRWDVKANMRQALEAGGDPGIGQWINHTCCDIHCNAEFQLTRALSGDPRRGSIDEEGVIILVVRASKPIKRQETVLVHYNPRGGIQSWETVFKCTCCLCRGKCGPSALSSGSTERSFAESIRQAQHNGVLNERDITKGDFVSTPQKDFWGNVVESHLGGVTVRGFCAKSQSLISKRVQAAEAQKGTPLLRWKGAAQVLSLPAIAKIWAHQRHTSGGGGWLEDQTVDAAIRWSLYGDTRVGALAPCPGRNGYISLVLLQELQVQIQNYQEREGMLTKPLLQVALEGLTGINGRLWKEADDSQLEKGIELDIPALKQALGTSLELSLEVRHQLNLHGLQPYHYVKTGSRTLVPRQQRNNSLVKWLKKFGYRLDLSAMDNVFATLHTVNHYFTIAWCKVTGAFTLRDSLAQETKPVHCRAMILLWAFLLASARMEGNLWSRAPVLALSESQVLGKFRTFLLQRPSGEQQGPLSQWERDNLRRMGIVVHNDSEKVAGAWTWSRDPHFPQQSNGIDCGMAAVVTVIHVSRGWQIPNLHETSIKGYRQWLVQVITNDSEEVFQVPCYRCGTIQLQPQVKKVECRDRQRCKEARESVSDNVIYGDPGGNQSIGPGCKRSAEVIQAQPQKPKQGSNNGTSGKPKPQAYKTKVADTTNMDLDGVSDQVQHPSAKTETLGLGAETEPGEMHESGGKTKVAANRQLNRRDAHKGKQPPRQTQSKKRQKLLTECLKANTTSRPSVEKLTNTDHEILGKPTLGKKLVQGRESCSAWVCNLLGVKQDSRCPVSARGKTADRCAKCVNPIAESQPPIQCLRCKTVKYCTDTCKKLHWKQGHGKACTPDNAWCPSCGEEVNIEAETSTPCARCEKVVYCSHRCLNIDFDSHLHKCPLVLPEVLNGNRQQMAVGEGTDWVQAPTLAQPGGSGQQRRMLVDDENVIANVRHERWQLSKIRRQALEDEDRDAKKCEEARDKVLEWCENHDPRSSLEAWRAARSCAKVVTELLRTTTGDVDFNCTSEEWQVAIRVRDELLLPMAQILGEERGQRIWKACIEKEPEVQLCFQGIQASTKHQALTLLRDAGIDAGDEEWHRATCAIRRRGGARPPLAAVTLLVRPNEPLRQLLVGQRGLGQDKIEIWKCREGEQLQNVTTLIQDPEAGGHSLRSWTRIYGLLGISEAIQRELVLLSLMLEQPSFVPLDMLIGELENPCALTEVWRTQGKGGGPIQIAGNQAMVAPGNPYATNEGWSIAGRDCYESRRLASSHDCLHRGAGAHTPKALVRVGVPEWNPATTKWANEQVGVSQECAKRVRGLIEMMPEWWSNCQVRMRWRALERGSARERESTVCIRFTQVESEGPCANRQITTKEVEAEVLSLANNIRAQCFQHAENFVSGDIRYQGFEDLEGKGKGMITFNRRKASLFEVDVAIGCLLGFYLGNGIQAHSGRAYKWCPFWGKMGATSVRLTSITRAYDHYAKSRTTVTFGTRGSGREGWTVTNPKEKMIKKMLQLLQQRAGSGPMLALLKMPVWEPESRMFVARQQKAPAAIGPEVSESSAEGKKKAATANHLAAMPMWWQKFDQTTHGAHQDNEIYM
jgi:hypothetical protein